MKTASAVVLAVVCVIAFAGTASAYDPRVDHIKARAEGLFLSFSVRSVDYTGDIRRDLTLWHIEKAFFVPHLNGTWAADLGLGIGGKTAYGSWEVRYSLALPNATVGGESHTLQMHNLEVIGRSFIVKNETFHPYGLLGIDVSLLMIANGSYYQGSRLNAAFAGGGISAGGGLMLDLNARTFISVEALYRFTVFLYAYGQGKGRDINYMRVGTVDGAPFGRLLRTPGLGLSISLGFML
jgi:hypothetical protein